MVALQPKTTKRALLVGLASLAVAHGHLVMATGNPFLRTDRALQRLTRMLDELVDGNGLPPQVQPLWRRVVQQPAQQTDMTTPQAVAPQSVLAFRAEAVETADTYIIQADLAGVKRGDVKIAFHDGNVLGVTATRVNPYEAASKPAAAADEGMQKDKGAKANEVEVTQPSAADDAAEAYPKYLMREIAYGKTFRSFKLPSDASPETASARFEDGVLTIVIKKREQPKEKVIEIE